MSTAFAKGREVTVRDARLNTLTMYELDETRVQLDAVIGEQDGVMTPEQEALWDAIPVAFEIKVENTALLIREREAQADMVRREAARLSEWAASLEGDGDRLRALLLNRMQAFGQEEVRGRVKVSIAKTPQAVVTKRDLNEADLRELAVLAPYAVRVKPEAFSLDREAIKAQYKTTGALPAAVADVVALQSGVRLSIR